MKLMKDSLDSKAEQKNEDRKGRFARFKDALKETAKKAVVVTSVCIAATFAACDNGNTNSDGGDTDADITEDGGNGHDTDANDGGPDTDNPNSLCAMYPEEGEHRITVGLQEGFYPDCDEEGFMFIEKYESGAVVFFIFNVNSPGGGTTEMYQPGVPETQYVGELGEVTLELCGSTGGPCRYDAGGISGDPNCTATVAVDRNILCE